MLLIQAVQTALRALQGTMLMRKVQCTVQPVNQVISLLVVRRSACPVQMAVSAPGRDAQSAPSAVLVKLPTKTAPAAPSVRQECFLTSNQQRVSRVTPVATVRVKVVESAHLVRQGLTLRNREGQTARLALRARCKEILECPRAMPADRDHIKVWWD